jgi:uncharacterized membrane protein
MKQDRFKSKAAWLSVFSIIAFLLGNYGLYDAIGMTSETFQRFADLLFVALTAFGVFNNPTDADNY